MVKKICPHCGHELEILFGHKNKNIEAPVAASTLGRIKQHYKIIVLGGIAIYTIVVHTI